MEVKMGVRRLADGKEIRGGALLLTSDTWNFMTGSVVVLDGGHIAG